MGLTAMLKSAAGPTVSVVEDVIVPSVAEIVVFPDPAVVASPMLPAVLLITATVFSEDTQFTIAVMSVLVPSLYVPVAVNCCVEPDGMDGFCGEMEIETSVAALTVRLAVPFTDPDAAVMVMVPAATPVARPCEPGESLIVATVPSVELQ